MQKIALHLQIAARTKANDERDMFARSAFNRYYYNMFLLVRDMMYELIPDFKGLSHIDYPKNLKGDFTKKQRLAKKSARRTGDIDLIRKFDRGIQATSALASMMETAYGIRVVADYKPEEAVSFADSKRFSLKNVDISVAHNWDGQVHLFINSIKQSWSEI